MKPHRFVPETAAAAALAAQGLMAHATTPFVVHDIRIEGLQRVEPGTVFAYLPIKQGDTFSGDRASEAIRALYATGFFNDVQIATEGSIVIVHVVERPAIGSIDFSGHREFDNDNPAKALRAVGLSPGRYYDKALAEKAEQELKCQYLTLGYYAAGVKSTITPTGPLKLGLGFPLTKHSGDQYQKFQFQTGTAF